ncbi:hypothetical protein J2795_002392 [Chryseobacterium bernardetii]|uniref:Uncharacterized protein n=2 Tax=Chryseobacterium TaxID=59732 RepID=A0A543EGF3_9FLAO|nr:MULTISPECIES: hypothetical protein [Chryseobacterium]MDR6370680.1 hypothetical protein [Chryseobacterium vietnamense]MDR6441686.1 hypothetical protein [Chryseobacterium bernardetii]TQM20637.1 hypothetical protein FB551_0310 [Chryseobacterium aquifrigidense]
MTEKFQAIESKINKPVTYFLMGIIWIAIILIIVVIGVIFGHIYNHFRQYLENDPGIFFTLIIALLLLIFCAIALIMALTYRKKQRIRKAVVDEKGVTFYNNQNTIIDTLLYEELQSTQSSSDDVFVLNTQTVKYGKTTLQIYQKDRTGKIIQAPVDLNLQLVIVSNQYELYRHFLKGIQHFRPDLKISLQTIEQYNLSSEPQKTEFGIFEYVMSAIFILAAAGLIYVFTLVIKILI